MAVRDILIPLQALPTSLPGTAQYTFGTSGTNQKMHVRGLVLANGDSSEHTFTLHHVAAGGSATNSNRRFAGIAIAANTTYEEEYLESEWIMRAGDAIFAFADDALVNIFLSGEADE